MKHSIRKKMVLISITSTMISFVLILVCFNLITSSYIKREATKELNHAAASTTGLPVSISTLPVQMSSQSIANPDAVALQATQINEVSNVIYSALQQSDTLNNVEFILTDQTNELIYPATTLPVVNQEGVLSTTSLYNSKEIESLHAYTADYPYDTPTKALINGVNYYVMKAKFSDASSILFYKNVQSLSKLVSDVNLVLCILLILSALLTMILTLFFTNGMVASIKKLGMFANAIGGDNFQGQTLNLKEKELAILEYDMNRMAVRLAEYDSEQKTFFQNVSHELRTPLMSIQGYAEGIVHNVFEDKEEAAKVIVTESNRLSYMVGDLLYLSRMDSKEGNVIHEEFDLTDTIQEVIEQINPLLAGKKIIFQRTDHPLLYNGNKDEMKKAILNIMTNSVRHAKSTIVVTCSLDNGIRIEFADDGEGIKDKDLPHIFKRFYKGEGGCSGIGLAIAETVIKNHKGKITARNRDGAVFTIQLG